MSVRRIAAIAVLWVMSLLVVAGIAKAQAYSMEPLREPKIVFGPDLGFRIEGYRNGFPVGLLVVKVNGEWVEAHFGSKVQKHLVR